jgi:hypothetical protein
VEDVRPGYDGLEGVCDIRVAYADPGYDAEETHKADDTRAVWRSTSVTRLLERRG